MEGKNGSTRRLSLALLAVLVLGGGAYLLTTRKPAEPTQAAAVSRSTDTGAATAKACALRFASAPDTRVLLFPTEAGLSEYIKAAAAADLEASRVIRDTHGAFAVDPGTPCALVERNAEKAKVRVLEGESRGQLAWTTAETTGM